MERCELDLSMFVEPSIALMNPAASHGSDPAIDVACFAHPAVPREQNVEHVDDGVLGAPSMLELVSAIRSLTARGGQHPYVVVVNAEQDARPPRAVLKDVETQTHVETLPPISRGVATDDDLCTVLLPEQQMDIAESADSNAAAPEQCTESANFDDAEDQCDWEEGYDGSAPADDSEPHDDVGSTDSGFPSADDFSMQVSVRVRDAVAEVIARARKDERETWGALVDDAIKRAGMIEPFALDILRIQMDESSERVTRIEEEQIHFNNCISSACAAERAISERRRAAIIARNDAELRALKARLETFERRVNERAKLVIPTIDDIRQVVRSASEVQFSPSIRRPETEIVDGVWIDF